MEQDYLGRGISGSMFGYPREIRHWICSDGRIFTDYERAKEHEDFLTKEANEPTTHSAANCSKNGIYEPLDVRF